MNELFSKEAIFTAVGVIGAFIASLYGGWTSGMTTLVILMIIDYLTGLLVAAVFGKSKKTADGKPESRAESCLWQW